MTLKAAQEMGRRRMRSMTVEEREKLASAAGKAGSDALTPEQRTERAKKAAAARWGIKPTTKKAGKKKGGK